MNKSHLFGTVCVCLAVGMLPNTLNASLIGDSVDYDRFFDGTSQVSQTSIVGAGIEFTEVDKGLTSDISADTIRIDFDIFGVSFNTGSPNQFIRWSSLDWVGKPGAVITGVDVTFGGLIIRNGSTPLPLPFSENNVTFGDHFVDLEIGGYMFEDAFVEIGLQTTVVPIPPALWLFGSGLLGMIGIARKKKAA